MAETAEPELRLPEEQEPTTTSTSEDDIDSSSFDFDRIGIFTVDTDFDDVDPVADFFTCAPGPQPQIDDQRGCDLDDHLEVVEIRSSRSSVVDSVENLGDGGARLAIDDIFGDVAGDDSVVVDDLINPFSDDLFLGVSDGNVDVGFDFSWLGLGFDCGVCDDDDDDESTVGVIIDERGDEFIVGRRDELAESSEPYVDRNGLGVVEIESVSDNEGAIPLCGDCLRLEGEMEESNEDLEWERVEEERIELRREVHRSLMIANEEVASLVSVESDEANEATIDEAMRNLEWEVPEHDSDDSDEEDDYMYHADYDLVFGQFTDSEIKGNAPAAKSVVDGLPPMDENSGDAFCAICKDEILSEEPTKQLPCSHYYHGECIVPWLGIRNTCPVCRFELPTDDPECERRRREEEDNDVAMAAFEETLLRLGYAVFVEPL